MKTLMIAGAVAAALISGPALANDEKTRAFAACKAEVESVLGDEARISLRKIRNHGSDLKVSLRVRQPGAEATTIDCIHGDNGVAFQTKGGEPLDLVAIVEKSSNTAIN